MLINKPRYKIPDFLILKKGGLSCIFKIIVFYDNNDKRITLNKNFWFCLQDGSRSWGRKIARSFLLDLKPKTETD